MKQITEITPEQKKALEAHAQEWIRRSLEERPADREKAERGINEYYRLAGFEPPAKIVWCDNPIQVVRHGSILDWIETKYGAGCELDEARVEEAKREISPDAWRNYHGGGAWPAWPAAHGTAVRDVLGCQEAFDEKANRALDAAVDVTECWWWWSGASGKWAYVSERPHRIRRDERGRLHSTDGPSLAWKGWELFHLHGVAVPERIVMKPESITLEEIAGEANAEMRSILIEQFGFEKYLTDVGETVHEDNDKWGRPRRLVMTRDRTAAMVIVTNAQVEPDGTYRRYAIPVHPELRPLLDVRDGEAVFGEPQKLTCHAAVASTFGVRAEEYDPELET